MNWIKKHFLSGVMSDFQYVGNFPKCGEAANMFVLMSAGILPAWMSAGILPALLLFYCYILFPRADHISRFQLFNNSPDFPITSVPNILDLSIPTRSIFLLPLANSSSFCCEKFTPYTRFFDPCSCFDRFGLAFHETDRKKRGEMDWGFRFSCFWNGADRHVWLQPGNDVPSGLASVRCVGSGWLDFVFDRVQFLVAMTLQAHCKCTWLVWLKLDW